MCISALAPAASRPTARTITISRLTSFCSKSHSSGPFLLTEWEPEDRIVLTRNPRYWEAQSVGIDRIVFLPVADGNTNLSLYKAGAVHSGPAAR